jgi:hypothetical protein
VDQRADLLQEALAHLWEQELRHPGMTTSWYLQNCRFFVGNILRSGRSVDSIKRRLSERAREHCALEGCALPDCLVCQVDPAEHASARDAVNEISRRLEPRDRAILTLLLEGHGIREIGRRLHLSHAAVVKSRGRIAAAAVHVGILASGWI